MYALKYPVNSMAHFMHYKCINLSAALCLRPLIQRDKAKVAYAPLLSEEAETASILRRILVPLSFDIVLLYDFIPGGLVGHEAYIQVKGFEGDPQSPGLLLLRHQPLVFSLSLTVCA